MVVHTSDRAAIIVAGGVGYSVAMTSKMLASLSKKRGTVKVFVFSRMNPREGTFEYYGFSNSQEYELFKILTSFFFVFLVKLIYQFVEIFLSCDCYNILMEQNKTN